MTTLDEYLIQFHIFTPEKIIIKFLFLLAKYSINESSLTVITAPRYVAGPCRESHLVNRLEDDFHQIMRSEVETCWSAPAGSQSSSQKTPVHLTETAFSTLILRKSCPPHGQSL